MRTTLVFCLLLPLRVYGAKHIDAWSKCHLFFDDITLQFEKDQNTEDIELAKSISSSIQNINKQYQDIVAILSEIAEKEISVPYLNDVFHEQVTKDNMLDYVGMTSKELTSLNQTKQNQDFTNLLQLKQHLDQAIQQNTMKYHKKIKKHLDRLDQQIQLYKKNYMQK